MELILNHLKQHTIISSQYVQTLRQSLEKEYPDYTSFQQAQLFAQTLHSILDPTLIPFDAHLQQHIKYTLFKKTLHKEQFSIDALDILDAYTQLEEVGSHNLLTLTEWINHYQDIPLSLEQVHDLMNYLNQDSSPPKKSSFFINPLKCLVLSFSVFIAITLVTLYKMNSPYLATDTSHFDLNSTSIELPISLELATAANYMQPTLQYQEFNQDALRSWLEERNSLLAYEPYFSTIIATAKDFNIHPLLLFSITGQEQNFVPKVHERATEIANNPFNLYGSWKDFNTSIEESSQIVSRTLINLGKDCPKDEDQIKWINKSYAEDPNWHLGVSYFFNELQSVTALSH